MPDPLLVLASSSPRRRALLAHLGLPFGVAFPDVDEATRPGEGPVDYVMRVARSKALSVAATTSLVVLAADTAVIVDDQILGKPMNATEAESMLSMLGGRSHQVLTGVAVARQGVVVGQSVVETTVHMTPISSRAARWYVESGEPLDKAGAYAVQERGGVFVERIEGSVSNVVGLPLAETASLLRQCGLDPTAQA